VVPGSFGNVPIVVMTSMSDFAYRLASIMVGSQVGEGTHGKRRGRLRIVPRASRILRDQMMLALRAAGPPLLFGLRMWAAVCLALTIAFWLELDNPFWAGTSAAIVCQPMLGASLRKGWFRMVGTVVGAIAAVVLSACFPQSRAGFLICLSLWCGVCALVATVLRNFASYAAALAGYTVAIIAGDELGANGGAFMLAVTRATEICIGIVCAGIVLAGTDFGRTRRQLAMLLGGIAAEITGGLIRSLGLARSDQLATAVVRRDLMRRVGALDAIADTARGEAPELRADPRPLQAAMDGLFSALSGWSAVANHLATIPDLDGAEESAAILQVLPAEPRASSIESDAVNWVSEPAQARKFCAAAVRALVALPATEPSLRLLADRMAQALLGISHVTDALVLLREPGSAVPCRVVSNIRVADWLPPVLNGLRAFVTIGIASIVWIATAWPNGASMVVFAAIVVTILPPRGNQAYAVAVDLMLGSLLAAAVAGIIAFAVLPAQPSYAGFCMALGLVLVPAGAMVAQAWRPLPFFAAAFLFVQLVSPENQMTYDVEQFYNQAMAIVAGIGIAALALTLMPPLSTAVQSRRLLALMLRDLRRMAAGAIRPSQAAWEGRVYGRLAAMPAQAPPLRWSRLAANQTVGSAIIHLRRTVGRFDAEAKLEQALHDFAHGDNATAIANLAKLDKSLATKPDAAALLRARGTIGTMIETLTRHAVYFDSL
jgi:uncharacterized membrane protein YccC